MENKKQILSMQLNVDDFAPASDSEKESLSVMREVTSGSVSAASRRPSPVL